MIRCRNEPYCESEEVIDDYFANKSKRLWLLKNRIRFDPSKFGRESIILESEIEKVNINGSHTRQAFKIHKTELSLQDLVMDFDELTELKDSSVFQLKKSETIIYDKQAWDFEKGVEIQMDFDLNMIERSSYTALDVLSDVGGIQSMLYSLISLVLGLFNTRLVDDYLISRLYELRANVLQKRRCILSQRKKQLSEARSALEQELDVVKTFRLRRFTLLALRKLLEPDEFQELKRKSKLLPLNSSSNPGAR